MSAIEGVVAYQRWSLRGVPLYVDTQVGIECVYTLSTCTGWCPAMPGRGEKQVAQLPSFSVFWNTIFLPALRTMLCEWYYKRVIFSFSGSFSCVRMYCRCRLEH